MGFNFRCSRSIHAQLIELGRWWQIEGGSVNMGASVPIEGVLVQIRCPTQKVEMTAMKLARVNGFTCRAGSTCRVLRTPTHNPPSPRDQYIWCIMFPLCHRVSFQAPEFDQRVLLFHRLFHQLSACYSLRDLIRCFDSRALAAESKFTR